MSSSMPLYQPAPRPLEVVPKVEKLAWEDFQRVFRRRFQQGDHVSVFGGPKAGKTHLGVLIAEMRTYSFFLALKPRDPIIPRMNARGWTITDSLEPAMQQVEVKRKVDGQELKTVEPLYPRVVFWPFPVPAADATLETQAELKAAATRSSMIWLQRVGSWAVLWDESNYMTDILRLRREMSEFWYTARSNLVSVIALAQRPAYIPKIAYAAPQHLFIFQCTEREDAQRLGEIAGGMDWKPLAAAISKLSWNRHEFLYVAPHNRESYVSHCPPW